MYQMNKVLEYLIRDEYSKIQSQKFLLSLNDLNKSKSQLKIPTLEENWIISKPQLATIPQYQSKYIKEIQVHYYSLDLLRGQL